MTERSTYQQLSQKRRRFVDEYLVDYNATQAAIRAGYAETSAHTQGGRLLRDERIKKALNEAIDAQQRRTHITADRVLLEIARIATFDPRALFDSDGNPLPIEQLDDDTAAVIAGVDVMSAGQGAQITKYRLSSKTDALEKLMKHLGQYQADNNQHNETLADALNKGLERVKSNKQ